MRRRVLGRVVPCELDQQQGGGVAAHEGVERGRQRRDPRPSSIIVRSTSSTAAGPSATRCCVASIASRKVGKWQTPTALWRGSGESLSSISSISASVPSDPTRRWARFTGTLGRRQRVDVVAADPPQQLRETCGDLVRLARAQFQHQASDERRSTSLASLDRAEPRPAAIGQQRVDRIDVLAHPAVADRAAAAGIVGRHARRSWRGTRSRRRPGTTARAASAPGSARRARRPAPPRRAAPPGRSRGSRSRWRE